MVIDAPPKPRSAIFDRLDFVPTKRQEEIVYSPFRFILISGGERGGKSLISVMLALLRILEAGPGLYWLIAADYDRTRAEFDYFIEAFVKLGLIPQGAKGKDRGGYFSGAVNPGFIEVPFGNGVIRIETKSASDPRTIAMKAPDGIIICEASQVDLETYNKCSTRVAEKRGWLILAGTFEHDSPWYPSLYKAWLPGIGDAKSYKLPSPDNPHVYPGGLNDPEILRIKRENSDDHFLERIMGEPVPPTGLVFKEFRPEIHVQDVKYIPGLPIHISVDPGWNHAYAVPAWQYVNGVVQVFDLVYEQEFITEQIIDIVRLKLWFKDIESGSIDIAATQHQGTVPVSDIWAKPPRTPNPEDPDQSTGGIGIRLHSKKVKINDGIERLKGFLKPDPPRIVFSPVCQGLISEFGGAPNPFDGQSRVYRWKYDRDGNKVGTVPEDKSNDAIKALIYGIVDKFGYATPSRVRRQIPVTYWGGGNRGHDAGAGRLVRVR